MICLVAPLILWMIQMQSIPGTEQSSSTMKPTCLNAIDTISISPGFDISNLFEKDKSRWSDARFKIQKSVSTIVSRLEEVALIGSFKVSIGTMIKLSLWTYKSRIQAVKLVIDICTGEGWLSEVTRLLLKC